MPREMNDKKKASVLRLVRVFFSGIGMFLPLFLLLLRLWQVQVLQGPDHQRRIQRQSIRPILLNPVRGRLLASGGEVLVGNRSSYDLVFHVSEMRQPGPRLKTMRHIMASASWLAKVTGREHELTMEAVKKHFEQQLVMPMSVIVDLTAEEIAKIMEMSPPIPGVEVLPQLGRDYPWPGTGTHLTGFTGKVWPDARSKVGDEFALIYVSKEQRGRAGLEEYYDSALSGRQGLRQLRVDTLGYVHEELPGTIMPVDGFDLHLTIDLQAQILADEALLGKRGALVMVDVDSGAVLALASSPTYDLSELSGNVYQQLRQDQENYPLLNRAVDGSYMPGSILKPLVALAAMSHGLIQHDEAYHCFGSYLVGNVPIRCANIWGHGDIALVRAIAVSCNPYFLHAGVECGLDVLTPFFASAGIGSRCGLDYPEAASGLLPTRQLAQRLWRRNWLRIDTAYVSIGQGAIEMTPLQAALMTAALANGGCLYRPYLVQSVVAPDGRVLQETPPLIRSRLPSSTDDLAMICDGMARAVSAREGSAHGLQRVGVPMAGKTGTAEVGPRTARYKNAWVICHGPLPQSKFALACIIEHGESGGKTAVPVVADFLHKWLSAKAASE